MALTPEQDAIVNAGDVDLAVSAGAGTGKTHVLVERYVTLLGRCSIPEIVAVTFTEAAAAEMRQRVRREVLSRPELREHQPHVDEAIIGTIHSLCLRILRAHPVEAALDPAVAVLGEDEAELFRLEASIAAIDAAAEVEDERTGALQALGVFQAGKLLPQMVAARDDVRAAFAALPEDGEGIARVLREQVDHACEQAVAPLRHTLPGALDDIASDALDPNDLLASRIAEARSTLDGVEDCDLAELVDRLRSARSALNLQGGRAAAWAVPINDVKDAVRAIRERIDEATGATRPWDEELDSAAASVLPGLRTLFEDACARYETMKREARGLDFLDLEVAAVDLLEKHAHVAEHYRRTWRHVMVDEAQDVSGIQARLIRAFTAESSLSPVRPRLFLVGDEKQSIYRFRGAQVRQFRELREAVLAAGGEVLPLSASFRTHSDLVQRANELFGVAFQDSEVTMEPMSGRPGDPPQGPHLVAMPIEGDVTAREKDLAEADTVAAEIRRLLDEGRLIWDKGRREYRPVRPGDIAILLRRYLNVHLFEQALEAHDVSFATPSGTGFFTRPEVLDLTNLLRWLVEPDDQIALMGVLRSPLFILRDDTLYRLRDGRRPMQYALAEPPEDLPDDERARCVFAGEVLSRLRDSARIAGAAAVIEEALEATGYEATWAAMSGGEQALANIRKFARLCRDLSAHTIAEVVTYLERRRDELATREGPAVLDRPDALQIMTVHGAKGLEFPVVFVPEADSPPFVSWDVVRWRAGEGISFTFDRREGDDRRPRPAYYELLMAREKQDESEEHRRLFYVAATRAGDYLYLSGEQKGNDAWMPRVQEAIDLGVLRDVEVRLPVDATLLVRTGRAAIRPVIVPAEDTEDPYTPPLLARPPVIPLRTSTPATAIKVVERHFRGRGDGLGLVRGRIVHRAIEALAAGDEPRAAVPAITLEEGADLDVAARALLQDEALEMVERFRSSPIGQAVAAADARFEVPFAWDWDGIPVHGQIDLLYRDAVGAWWIVDFKTDRVEPGNEVEAAEAYLVQLGLYAAALEAAVGERPRAGLLFLRTGTLHEPPPDALASALDAARAAVDRGLVLVTEDDDELVVTESA